MLTYCILISDTNVSPLPGMCIQHEHLVTVLTVLHHAPVYVDVVTVSGYPERCHPVLRYLSRHVGLRPLVSFCQGDN